MIGIDRNFKKYDYAGTFRLYENVRTTDKSTPFFAQLNRIIIPK
jgi:hypothetical protein